MGALIVIVGGQYGSEGKGAVTGWLAQQAPAQVACVRVAGPNAGHTVIGIGPDGEFGHPWPLRSVPVAAVTRPDARLFIAAGSEIDPVVLRDELQALDKAGYAASERLTIDPAATILSPQHVHAEQAAGLTGRLGSTGKGVGAARADRIMRRAVTVAEAAADDAWFDLRVAPVAPILETLLAHDASVYVEGTQGYGLGLHTEHYPQVTSSDCRAIDFLAMVGLSPWSPEVSSFRVVLACRPNPIRVAGNSGPMEGETTWEALGLTPELTTVTRKIRRVGAWDGALVRQAVHANGGAPIVRLALTMADHVFPGLAGVNGAVHYQDLQPYHAFIEQIERETLADVNLLGTGPGTMVVIDRG